jgi:dephospho-CoA kinase
MFKLTQTVSLLFSFFPAGVVISILTVRLASRDVASTALPQVWNTFVKCVASYLVWTYLIFLRWPDGTGFTADCDLDSLSYWMPIKAYVNDGGNASGSASTMCTPTSALMITLILGLRCLLFIAGATLGSALQPVGLTGGIACGKSTVSQMLRDPDPDSDPSGKRKNRAAAFSIVDVDAIAHDILVPGKMGGDCGYRRVVNAFSGHDIFVKSDADAEQPQIDRRKLGDIIFKDSSKRRLLNKITHPLITKIMMKQIVRKGLFPKSKNASIVCVDIPLLFEGGLIMKLFFGIKIVVGCDQNIQLARLVARNKDLTQEQCKDRIQSQIPVDRKAKMADIVIWNNGTKEDLLRQVESAQKEVMYRTHAFGFVTLPKLILLASALTIPSCIFEASKLSGLILD